MPYHWVGTRLAFFEIPLKGDGTGTPGQPIATAPTTLAVTHHNPQQQFWKQDRSGGMPEKWICFKHPGFFMAFYQRRQWWFSARHGQASCSKLKNNRFFLSLLVGVVFTLWQLESQWVLLLLFKFWWIRHVSWTIEPLNHWWAIVNHCH